jgi:hypothetical protein
MLVSPMNCGLKAEEENKIFLSWGTIAFALYLHLPHHHNNSSLLFQPPMLSFLFV